MKFHVAKFATANSTWHNPPPPKKKKSFFGVFLTAMSSLVCVLRAPTYAIRPMTKSVFRTPSLARQRRANPSLPPRTLGSWCV